MSTLSGLYPNAITPTVSPFGDLAQRAQQRRDNDAAVFAPIEASLATAPGQNRLGKPNTAGSELASKSLSAESNLIANDQSEEAATEDQSSAIQRQRDETQTTRQQADQRLLEQDIETIRELAQRDREVRSHEQAHQSVGGQHAGGMALSYQRGPDGRRYAVAGEVAIDISPVSGDPAATLAKAEQVRRAALAPAEPSAQDRSVAAQATQLRTEALVELRAELSPPDREVSSDDSGDVQNEEAEPASGAASADIASQSAAQSAQRTAGPEERTRQEASRSLLEYQFQEPVNMLGRELDFMV